MLVFHFGFMTYCPTNSDQLDDCHCYCPLFVDVESVRKLILLLDDLQPSTSLLLLQQPQQHEIRPTVVVVADGDDDDWRTLLPIADRPVHHEFARDFDNLALRNHPV